MSLIHNIIYKKPLDVSILLKFVSTIKNAAYKNKGENVWYFWINRKSTRGVDIIFEKDYIEVRNTILSNKHDYDLTNMIVAKILSLTDGMIIDENNKQVSILPLFDSKSIAKKEIRDCKNIHLLSKEYEDIAIYGPIRIVHFGKRLYEQYKGLNDEQLKEKMFETILTVNYKIPNFETNFLMQIGNNDEDKKTLMLLTNEENCIIGKYDFILINKDGEGQSPIMINNSILNTMLPSNWTLADEFTIVAPITSKNEWNKLLANAEHYDLTEDFLKSKMQITKGEFKK